MYRSLLICLIAVLNVNCDEGNITLPAIGPNHSSLFDYAMYYSNRPALYRRPTTVLRAYDRYGLEPRPYTGETSGRSYFGGPRTSGTSLRRNSLFNKRDQFFKYRYNNAYRRSRGILIDNDRDYFPYDLNGNPAYTNPRMQPYLTNYY